MRSSSRVRRLVACLAGGMLCSLPAACAGHVDETTAVRAVAGTRIEFSFSPGIIGERNPLVVNVARDGKPLRGARVTVLCFMPSMPMGERPLAAAEAEPGTYRIADGRLSMGGKWRADVRIAAPSQPPAEAVFDFTVKDR
jgi:hypothetical protein